MRHLKSTYGSQLRVLLITILFFSGIVYFIIIEPFRQNSIAVYYLWIEALFFIVLLSILLYGGVLYCFTSYKNHQIASELLDLLLFLHIVVFVSFVYLGVSANFLYGNKLFFFNNYYSVDFYNYLLKV
jgi:hypothetical protein